MKNKVLALIFFVSSAVFAQYGSTPTTKIKDIYSYNKYNGGDVAFTVEQPLPGCDGGFFISKSDPGFAANYAAILSAYHAKSPVVVYGWGDQLWSGSGAKFCKLDTIHLK